MKGQFLRINKGFFKDTMRLYLVSAIVFSVISALISYGVGYSMCDHSAASTNFHIDTVHIQIFVCIFMAYLGGSLARKLTDMNVAEVYASIPVSRDGIWTAHLLTGIIYSLMIMAASIIGMFLGELGGAISVGQSIGSYGYSAFEYMAELGMIMLEALMGFAFIGTAFSITGKVFAGIVTAGIGYSGISILILSLMNTGNVYGIGNIIFPFSAAARTAAVWVVSIVMVILFLLLFRRMFLTIRTESYSHAFRNARIQTIVGLILAFSILCTIAFTVSTVETEGGDILSDVNIIAEQAIRLVVICLIAYFVFMWISAKSFKKAAVSLKYLPISLLTVCAVMLLGSGLKKAYKNVDFSADNIAYYTVPSYIGGSDASDWYEDLIEYSLIPMSFTEYSNDRYGKGVSGEDEVRFTDHKMINEISKYLRSGKNSVDSFRSYVQPSIYVTLKNGKTYAVGISRNVDENISYINNARQNEEYRKAMYDIEPFKDGHFVLENRRADALYDTFIEELSGLTIEEREKLFDLSSIYYIDTYNYIAETVSYGVDVDFSEEEVPTPYARVLFIANRSNSLIRGVILNESTPKTLEAYLKIANELSAKNKELDKVLELLEDDSLDLDLQLEFVIWDKEKQKSYLYSIAADAGINSGFGYYELSDGELEMMDEYLMDSFHVSIDELTEAEIQMVYYTMDFTSRENYYEQNGIDEEGLTDEIRREDLTNLIGTVNGKSDQEYYSAARDFIKGILNESMDIDASRYVIIVGSMDITSVKKIEEFLYEYGESFSMNTASHFYDYPMAFGVSEEDYNGFIHDFIEKYDDDLQYGLAFHKGDRY